ncbi:MAG TPA: hypothetical protein VFQ45_14940 [Longimicrobium sp.]|nr:hypothetical protein [Longimicrobium sp.]
MRLFRWLTLAALLLPAPALRAQTPDSLPADTIAVDTAAADTLPPDPVRDFVYDLADPIALGSAAALGLWDHLGDEPEEWSGDAGGLWQRMVSRAGGHVVGTSVRHGLAAALGRSTRWEPCRGCASMEDRVAHVITETFTDRDDGGRRVFSEPFIAGTYAGALAPALWHPDVSFMDGVQAGTLSIAFTVVGRIAWALLEPLAPDARAP